MAELCLMASRGYPPDLGLAFDSEQGCKRVPTDFQCSLPHHGSNQDLVNPLALKSTSGLFDCKCAVRNDSNFMRPAFIDVIQGNHQDSVLFSFGIAEQCTKQEKIMKLLASGSTGVEGGLPDISMLCDMMRFRPLIADFPALTPCSQWVVSDFKTRHSLIYPTKEFFLDEPVVELMGDCCSCTASSCNFDSQLMHNRSMTEMHDIISVISDIYLMKNTNKSSKQTMLVPYFQRKRRASLNTTASKHITEKVGSLKSPDKAREKAPQKKKVVTSYDKERDTGYLRACEILLSILVNKNQPGKSEIQSLKKSGTELPQLLTQFSASVAGTGIAIILAVACRVASGASFCGSKFLSTGFGLGLISLSWAVHKLRATVVSIFKTSGKSGANEEKMMDLLERNMKDIYFRVAALMAVAVLKLI